MRFNAANNWETTINMAGGLGSGDTTVTVTDATGHPVPPFKASVGDEIMNVTAVSTNDLTVQRGQEGTSPASHDNGARVENRFTAEVQNELWDKVDGHTGATGDAHGVATDLVNGFMDSTDKAKLDGVEANANNYSHPATVQCDAATGDNFDSSGTYANLRAQATTNDDVGLSNVTNHKQARSTDGYDIQKNGIDGVGIINFKT